ncbi:general odorant-binding protein 45-like [Sabethes cyaneus]|uniref:general odorant-binding protein 45-like n=1 Tax=Sabethes cyaneus TaxID=53552 RepID=UPI00237D69EC|nr:general odorant-binding protein 45-like [Sabethes cyaneus]
MRLIFIILVAPLVGLVTAQLYHPLLPPTPRVGESHYSYQLKSFRQALDECAEYLVIPLEAVERLVSVSYVTNEKELKCLIRCAGISLGWWNDTTGLQNAVLQNYFLPAPGDTCYVGRTKECIETKLALCQDDCSKAYESFMCYYHQYGNLKCTNEYVPLTSLEAVQAAVTCINALQIPDDLLDQYSRGIFPECQETKCLYRCQYLAEGLFDARLGFSLSRLQAREHDNPEVEFLGENTRACTELALRSNCDECTRFYRAHKCFLKYGVAERTTAVLVQAAWVALGQHSCRRQNPFLMLPPYAALPHFAHFQTLVPRYVYPPFRTCQFCLR